MQRGQVPCYVSRSREKQKRNVPEATELLSPPRIGERLSRVKVLRTLCGLFRLCHLVSLSLPLQTIPSIVVLSSRSRRELVADVRVFERSISGKRSFDGNGSFAGDRVILQIQISNETVENIRK